ncbi:hypothetical protein [Gordonia sp. (in: high G+C Gram-positive bacteria)]|uniref:hypothetical protein n=1 Tax=Gordonia sp. (in: high G+C Gram-positive bacteria) TaxID=84139 RepID=UPI0035281F1F
MLRTGQDFAGLRVVGSLGVSEAGESYLVKAAQAAAEDSLLLLPESRGADPAYRRAFFDTAEKAASLGHPSVVAIRGYGDEQGRLWVASEYLAAPTAAALVRQSGAFAPADAAAAVVAVAGALEQARARGLVVSTLDPAQVFVVDGGGAGRRYAIGGLALPPSGHVPGLAERADQGALADFAAFLLIGGEPIGARVTTMRPEVPAAVDDVLARAARPAAERYDSPVDFARALHVALTGTEPAPEAFAPAPPANDVPTVGSGGITVPSLTVPSAPAAPAANPYASNPYASNPQASNPHTSNPQASNPYGAIPPQTAPYTQQGAAGYPAAGGGGYPPVYGVTGAPYGGGLPPAGKKKGVIGGLGAGALAAILGGVALIVVIAVVLVVALGGKGGGHDTASSSAPVITSSPELSTPPSTTADPVVVNGVPTQCALGTPTTRSTTEANLETGPIRIPAAALPAGWSPDPGSVLPFFTDAQGIVVSRPVGQQWQAQLTVGTLPDDFTGDLGDIAKKFAGCLLDTPGYSNTNARTPIINDTRDGSIENSSAKTVTLVGSVPVTRGPITSDDFTVLIAGTSPRTIVFGVAANVDAQSKGEIDHAIHEALFRAS